MLSIVHCTGKGDVTIKVKDDDFMDMVSGKLTPQKVNHHFLSFLVFYKLNTLYYYIHF